MASQQTEFPASGFVRKRAVCAYVGFGPTKLHELVKAKQFAQPIRLSQRVTVYRAEEVRAWVDKKTAERDATSRREAASHSRDSEGST